MIVHIRARNPHVKWPAAMPNTDKWVQKYDVIQFHISDGKLWFFMEDGSNTWLPISAVTRVAIEDPAYRSVTYKGEDKENEI